MPARILAVDPDLAQRHLVQRALSTLADAEVVIAHSRDSALAAIDRQLPDLVLLADLMPAADEEYLVAYLSVVPGASRVPVISIPPLRRQVGGRLAQGRDPRLFARDVAEYAVLARASAMDGAGRESPERRGFRRWGPLEVPWIRSVELASRGATNWINISSGGVLFRAGERPDFQVLKRYGVGTRGADLALRLTSGEQVVLPGRVIRCQPRSAGLYEIGFQFERRVDTLRLLPDGEESEACGAEVRAPACADPDLAALNQW